MEIGCNPHGRIRKTAGRYKFAPVFDNSTGKSQPCQEWNQCFGYMTAPENDDPPGISQYFFIQEMAWKGYYARYRPFLTRFFMKLLQIAVMTTIYRSIICQKGHAPMRRISQIQEEPAGMLTGQALHRPGQQRHQGRDSRIKILAEYAQFAAAYGPDICYRILVQDQWQYE